ncbi:MAG: cell division protein ZapA [Chiayiivirga sp.]|uniref:cell division protein ZapA n=1 Tax=Chiayiivirga sp. TaxID=2041042 RepID=UPI0025BC48AC|nr:cell division protein ZapA [Chiayiivirga sp.]MCI1711109.1 cell division protein ZapA [Chiayiivirga sp.]MCI1728094.1 cell division protein ZapA [Chiayiivirga sp.]
MTDPIAVRILDREYLVACPPDEREGLQSAASLLDGRMREIRSGNRMAGIDRIAVLAALNLAHELIQQRQGGGHRERELSRALGDLTRRLDGLLENVAPR